MTLFFQLRISFIFILTNSVFAIDSPAFGNFNSTSASTPSTLPSELPKVHIETSATVTGFEPEHTATDVEPATSTIEGEDPEEFPHAPGSRIRLETTATGFEDQIPATSTDVQFSDVFTSATSLATPTKARLLSLPPITPLPQVNSPAVTDRTNVPASPPAVTLDDKTLQPVKVTSIVIDGTTLSADGETATIGDPTAPTYIHVDPIGHPLAVIGSSTSTYDILPTPLTTIGNEPVTPLASALIVGTQTLTPGGPAITIGATPDAITLSISPSGQTIAIENGRTSLLAVPTSEAIAIGDITATLESSSYQYVVGSSTLVLNHPITVDGTVVEITTDAAGATVLVAGSDMASMTTPGGTMASMTAHGGTTTITLSPETRSGMTTETGSPTGPRSTTTSTVGGNSTDNTGAGRSTKDANAAWAILLSIVVVFLTGTGRIGYSYVEEYANRVKLPAASTVDEMVTQGEYIMDLESIQDSFGSLPQESRNHGKEIGIGIGISYPDRYTMHVR